MPRFRELKTNFVAGELDDLLRGRADIKHYFNGADLARNVVVIPQGGAKTRPGSRYLWTVPEASPGVRSNVRLCPFQFSTEQTYLFVFHHLKVTIFRNGTQVAQVTTPWASDDLIAHLTPEGDMIDAGISWAQSLNSLVIFHERFAPRELKRTGGHGEWALSTYTLRNIPRFDFGDVEYTNGVDEQQELAFPKPGDQGDWRTGDTFKLRLEDEETDNIRFSGTPSTLAGRIQSALRALPNVDSTGISVTWAATGTGTGTEDGIFTLKLTGRNGQRPWGALTYTVVSSKQVPTIEIYSTVKGVYPGENVWSTGRGYPRCGVFFQGRLWMAGSRSLPNTAWGSRTGDPHDFNIKRIADDYGIQATTDTDDVPAFINIYAGRHLQFFSTAGEFYVPASESEGVTPANMVLRRTSSRGSKPGLRVAEVDGATIFVQRRGRALREFIFADVEAAYQANNISLLSSHLMRDPVGFALRRSSSTEDADYLFLPNSDGTMTLFCTLRTQDVNAFTLWSTAGKYLDVASVLDEVYFATVRTIDGGEKTFIEVMDSSLTIDCAVVNNAAEGETGAVAAHLPNTECAIELDGFPQAHGATDAAGSVTFDRPAESAYAVGLAWPEVMPDKFPGLRWLLKTLPIEQGLQDGAMMGRKRRIVQLSARLNDTNGLIINGNRVAFQQFGANLLDQPPLAFTGIKNLRGLLGWDYDGAVVMGDTLATRATILGLSWAVSV